MKILTNTLFMPALFLYHHKIIWTLDLTDFLRNLPHLGLVPRDQGHVAAPPAELPGERLSDALGAASNNWK